MKKLCVHTRKTNSYQVNYYCWGLKKVLLLKDVFYNCSLDIKLLSCVCVSMYECVTDGAFSMCVLLPKSGGAVDQEDVGAAKCPGAASCWEEPGWSWSHIQGTGTTWFAHRRTAPRVHLYTGVFRCPAIGHRCTCIICWTWQFELFLSSAYVMSIFYMEAVILSSQGKLKGVCVSLWNAFCFCVSRWCCLSLKISRAARQSFLQSVKMWQRRDCRRSALWLLSQDRK